MVSAATEFISTNNWSEKEIEVYLERLVKINPTFSIIYFGDNNKLINSSNWTPAKDFDLRERNWYKKALEEGNMIYSDAYVDAITKRIVIAISKPVYDTNNEILGVVAGDIFIEDIIKLVQDVKSESIGYSFLIDGRGNILADPKYTYNNYLNLRNIETIAPNILGEMKDKGIGEKQLILDGKEGYLSEIYFKKQNEYQEELLAANEELEASYGQLSAMEMELRQQYIDLEEREESLYYLSYRDQLTGLYNRRFYEEEVVKVDNENNLPLTFIMADVNGLKLINDSFGHESGDQLLKTVGQAMKHSSKDEQPACRIGGDEFIVILPKTSNEEAEEMIKEIKKLADENNTLNIELSISFGVGTKYNKNENIYKVLKKVEDNMYSNKLVEGPSMRSKTIAAIVRALYEKNPREEAHSTRVSLLCKEMGYHLGMTDEKIKELETVGLLHDIGKVAISDHILEKPGPLNDEEFEEIKRHPEVGYRILSTTNEMAQMSEYILAHHERCDGLGYPKGLKCKDIPIISKIISIADAYDAMISDRPYRKGIKERMDLDKLG